MLSNTGNGITLLVANNASMLIGPYILTRYPAEHDFYLLVSDINKTEGTNIGGYQDCQISLL